MQSKPPDHSNEIKVPRWNPLVLTISAAVVIIFFAAGSYVTSLKIARPDANPDAFGSSPISSADEAPRRTGEGYVPFTHSTSAELPLVVVQPSHNRPRIATTKKVEAPVKEETQESQPAAAQSTQVEQSTTAPISSVSQTSTASRETTTTTQQTDTGASSSNESLSSSNTSTGDNATQDSSAQSQNSGTEAQPQTTSAETPNNESAAPANQ